MKSSNKPPKIPKRNLDEKSKWNTMRQYMDCRMYEATDDMLLKRTRIWSKNLVICRNKTKEHCISTQTVKHLNIDISIPSLTDFSISNFVNACKVAPAIVPFGSNPQWWATASMISGFGKVANALYPYKDSNMVLLSHLLFARAYVLYLPAGTPDDIHHMKYLDWKETHPDDKKKDSLLDYDPSCLVYHHPEYILAERDIRLPLRSNTETHINVPLTRNLKPGDQIVLSIQFATDNSFDLKFTNKVDIRVFVHSNYVIKNN